MSTDKTKRLFKQESPNDNIAKLLHIHKFAFGIFLKIKIAVKQKNV